VQCIADEQREDNEEERPFTVEEEGDNKMTFVKRLIAVPGFDEVTDSKTMCLIVVALPGGVDVAHAMMDTDKKGVTVSWNELGQAFNPAFFLGAMLQNPGYGHVLAHVRDDVENEILGDPNLQGVNNVWLRSTHFQFAETAELFLFNPFNRDRGTPAHIVRAPGGLTIDITACFRERTTAIQAPILDTELSIQEQLQHAAGCFPGLRDRLHQMNFNHFQPPPPPQAPPPQVQVPIPQPQAAQDHALMQQPGLCWHLFLTCSFNWIDLDWTMTLSLSPSFLKLAKSFFC